MGMKRIPSRGRLFSKGGDDTAQPKVDTTPAPPSPPSGPMTRARAKAIHDKVNSLLSSCDFDTPMDGILLHQSVLCILTYTPRTPPRGNTEAGVEEEWKGAEEAKPTPDPVATGPGTDPPSLGHSQPTLAPTCPVSTGSTTGWYRTRITVRETSRPVLDPVVTDSHTDPSGP